MQPRGRSQNGQHVAPRKAIDTNIRGVIPSSRSSTQAALLTCGARGENRAHEFLHLLFYSRPLGCSCGVVLCDAVSCPPVHSYIPKSLSPVQGFLRLACSVDLKPGDCEMVVDGGGHFSPTSYRWFTHMSLLISSYSAHSRAEGSPIEHLSR